MKMPISSNMFGRAKIKKEIKMSLNEKIRDRLVDYGHKLLNEPQKTFEFTKNIEADKLVADLTGHPHAFLLACLMDRQIKAEKAWLIPYLLKEKIGNFSIKTLDNLSIAEIKELFTKPEPLHRFVDGMSEVFYAAVRRIVEQYDCNASNIWNGNLSSAEVVYRILEFKGAGPKIANMAVNILAISFKLPFSDYFSIDISADVHVKRVFGRLGLCGKGSSVEQIIYKARALHPEFPGIIDMPCWTIGREWCRENEPNCSKCYMNDLCKSAIL